MAKKARVWTGTEFVELASAQTDLTAYSTTAQMNTAITAGVGLVPVLTQTIGTAVSSVVVSNAFSSTYDNYKIVVTGGTSSVAQENLTLQLGSTTAGYYWAWNYVSYTGTGAAAAGNNVASWRVGRTNVNYLSVNMDIVNPFLTNRKYFYAVGASGTESGMLSGITDFTTSITGFTLTVGSGTLTGGTIRVYGYKI